MIFSHTHTFIVNYFPKFPLLLHSCLLLQIPMIRNIRNIFRILTQSQCLGIISHLCNFPLLLLKFRMIFHVRLNFRIFRNSFQLRCFSDCRCFGLWYVSSEKKNKNKNYDLITSNHQVIMCRKKKDKRKK